MPYTLSTIVVSYTKRYPKKQIFQINLCKVEKLNLHTAVFKLKLEVCEAVSTAGYMREMLLTTMEWKCSEGTLGFAIKIHVSFNYSGMMLALCFTTKKTEDGS